MHFNDFGLLHAKASRELPTGFVADLDLDDDGREKLASKIRWKRSNLQAHTPDKRDFPRFMPRHPRSVMTMADGKRYPCFVIDISRSGAAISAAILPGKGTPVAIGSLIGRVVRRLEVGFAIEFIAVHELKDLERMLVEPPGSMTSLDESAE
ncbi:MAG: PilZ domain-containing protein [Devosia sp.]